MGLRRRELLVIRYISDADVVALAANGTGCEVAAQRNVATEYTAVQVILRHVVVPVLGCRGLCLRLRAFCVLGRARYECFVLIGSQEAGGRIGFGLELEQLHRYLFVRS